LWSVPESVAGHYYLGQAYEAAGRTQEAIAQYTTFLGIWKNADPGLKQVEDARASLRRLKGII
jgi:cytochrome c-type biogenesis protein CcmH/NrfG